MTVLSYYYCVFALALVFSGIYVYMWHKHFNSSFTMIFTLVPVSCLGYIFYAGSTNLEGAVAAIQITYVGGCFLQLFIVLNIISLCGIDLASWVRTAMFAVCAICFGAVLTIGRRDYYYKSVSFEMRDGSGVLIREYGVMHTVFYAVLVLLFAAGIAVIIFSWFKKKQIPRRILCLLAIPDTICVLSYFVIKKLIPQVDFVPAGYCLAEATLLLIVYRVNLYDVADTVIDSMVRERSIGYSSFDFQYRYLGSNEVAKALIPEFLDMTVDQKLGFSREEMRIREYLDSFVRDPERNTFEFSPSDSDERGDAGERIYKVTVNYLYEGSRRRGYIITFTDDTANRNYIRLLGSYNEDLQKDVEEKTKHIFDMQDNLIMSLAVMVESRDNSTGGHIMRTSEGVRILVDEIRKEGLLPLSEKFCRDVVKAAPMHDLGKIAVDDAVLRKPGRYTPEEYEKMKKHPEEGARVIREVLKNADDEAFKVIAENVAHYHHERWDGTGYPEKLAGEQIPLEARIMAVADVYDALVSKRVYKEPFSFEKANSIILEGMGTQFDPGLEEAYLRSRQRLEDYYRENSGIPYEKKEESPARQKIS
ncbi:MAG: HD domain-containing protein [Lachnospiraceae bacterium]|nr:HD domain-containing protein [Lachnospiraceae bacterium]